MALIAVIALLAAVAIWVMITQLVGEILLDGGESPWPELSGEAVTWLIIGPAIAASLLYGLLTWAGVWTRGLGLGGGTGTLAGTASGLDDDSARDPDAAKTYEAPSDF